MAAPDPGDSVEVRVRDWALSGDMWLTGRPEGPPLASPGRPASMAREELDRLADAMRERTGIDPSLPGVSLLGERAASAGLTRQGPWSCGRSFRAMPSADGWVGLSLAREADVELVPALVGADSPGEPWRAVETWAAGCSTAEAVGRLELLGLPGCAVPVDAIEAPDRPAVVTTAGGRRSQRRDRPMVVDLTALWAGPLCAHLLGLGGAEVIKVESTTRPDGARLGAVHFYDLLHAGHRSVALDLRNAVEVDALLGLLHAADIVLDASRPRALAQLGIQAENLVAEGVSWVSITAAGRSSSRVGFGDDVAVGAGLFVLDRDDVLPCGDAIADPLAGVVAARAGAEALLLEQATLVDVSMHHVCLEAAADRSVPANKVEYDALRGWCVDTGDEWAAVTTPAERAAAGPAAALGAHTTEVLGR